MKKICRTDLSVKVNGNFTGICSSEQRSCQKIADAAGFKPQNHTDFLLCNKFEEVSRVDFLLCLCGVLFNETYLEDS
ncbi:MAG: hypothetical protein IJ078_00105 [Succinivibrionaceae bacterium]|nr:hypothetical protein [Succinivibrionaceae bacterium]